MMSQQNTICHLLIHNYIKTTKLQHTGVHHVVFCTTHPIML